MRMPKIEDIKEAKRKFKKSNYRPWNFLEELEKESNSLNTSDNNIDEYDQKNRDKPTTNWQQTDNKPIAEPATNWQQTDNTIENRQQTDNKPTTKPITELATNWQQTGNKPITEPHFSSLVGLQRSIVSFIYNECKIARSKITESLTLEYISSALKTSIGTVKTTIYRLEKKGYIVRIEYKNGRGGWSKYELPEQLFRELLQIETDNKLTTNRQQTNNKLIAEPVTEPTTSIPSSSSYINNLTTTKASSSCDYKKDIFLAPEWEEVDIMPLIEIGLNKSHLLQIIQQNKLTPQMVNDSICAFAFDLAHNNKTAAIKGSALNYFMGIVRRGLPYAFPENYESLEQEALRKYHERKKMMVQQQSERENELINSEFNDWVLQLTEADIENKVPPAFQKMATNSPTKRAILRDFFKVNEWPNIKKKLLCGEPTSE
jgi:predicted transcriptional regulator